jgi:hypothetical protein
MSTTLTGSLAEREKIKQAEAMRTIEEMTDKYVYDKQPYDDILAVTACREAGIATEQFDKIIQLKQWMVDSIREVNLEDPEMEAEIAEVGKEREKVKKQKEEFDKETDSKLRSLNHRYNVASVRRQELRELKYAIARNCKSAAYIEQTDLTSVMLTDSKSTASNIQRLERDTAQEPRRTIAATGMHPSGKTATSQEKETAKSELAEINAELATLNRRYQLLQIQFPIQVENCARAAVNQAPLPLPIDYRLDTIGRVIPIYEGENSELQSDEPTVAPVTPDQDVVKEPTAAPTRATRAAKQAPAPPQMASDLDLI